MPNTNKIAVVLEMIESAQSSLRSAKAMLADVAGMSPTNVAAEQAQGLNMSQSEQGQIIEGVFDGQNMIGPDKRSYPVPANYASKSKLVQGDVLKLTITDQGNFVFKQIGPVPRRTVLGTVAYEDGQYKIIAEGNVYKVLVASITFYKAEVGQQLSILLPENGDVEWATVENVMPGDEMFVAETPDPDDHDPIKDMSEGEVKDEVEVKPAKKSTAKKTKKKADE